MATEKKRVLDIDTARAEGGVKSLRNELKKLKDILVTTEAGTQEYSDALRRAADIQHTLRESMAEINANAMDFGQIVGNVSKVAAGMSGMFQTVTATLSLFGVESEEVTKAIKTMQSVMSLTQGLTAIDEGIKAMNRLQRVMKSATGAARLFSAAMTPKVLLPIAAAVALIAANWEKVANALGIVTQKQKEQQMKQAKEDAKFYNNELKHTVDLQRQINKLRGLSDVEIEEQVLETIETEIMNADMRINELGVDIDDLNKKLKEQRKAYYEELRTAPGGPQVSSPLADILEKDVKYTETEIKLLQREKTALEESLPLYRTQKLEQQRIIEDTRTLAEEREKADKHTKAEAQRTKDLEAQRKAVEDAAKAYATLSQEISQYGMTEEEVAIDNLATQESEKLIIVANALKARLIDEEEAQKLREKIIKEYEERITKVEKDAAEERLQQQIDANNAAKEESLNAIEIDYAERELKISEKQVELSKKLADNTLLLEDYDAQLKSLDIERLENHFKMLQEELNVEGLTADEILNIRTQMVETQIQLNERAKQSAIDASQKTLESWQRATTITTQFGSATSEMFNAMADLMKENSEEQKSLQIVATVISTLTGMMQAIQGGNAMAAQMGLLAPVGWAMGAAQATATLATGVATIAKMQHPSSSSLSGGVSSPSASATNVLRTLNAPTLYSQTIQNASIEETMRNQRVYVVESDITNTAKKVVVTEKEAEF